MGDKKNHLYKLITFRFSLLNEKHVELSQMLEKDVSKGINSRNAIIIEALTEYYKSKEISRDWIEDTFLSKKEYSESSERQKKEIITELYHELMKVFAGGILSTGGDRRCVPAVTGKPPWLNCYRFYDTDHVKRHPVTCKVYVRDRKVSTVICGDFCKTGVTYS